MAYRNYLAHIPSSPLISGTKEDDDIVKNRAEKSNIATQLSLFD